jgi:hypothetical protein
MFGGREQIILAHLDHAAPSSLCLILFEHFNTPSLYPPYSVYADCHTGNTVVASIALSLSFLQRRGPSKQRRSSSASFGIHCLILLRPIINTNARQDETFSHLRLPPSLQRRIRRRLLRHTNDFHSTSPAFNRQIPPRPRCSGCLSLALFTLRVSSLL